MIPREPLESARRKARIASVTLRLLDRQWSFGDQLRTDLETEFPEFYAKFQRMEELSKSTEAAIEEVWQARESLLAVATDYMPDE